MNILPMQNQVPMSNQVLTDGGTEPGISDPGSPFRMKSLAVSATRHLTYSGGHFYLKKEKKKKHMDHGWGGYKPLNYIPPLCGEQRTVLLVKNLGSPQPVQWVWWAWPLKTLQDPSHHLPATESPLRQPVRAEWSLETTQPWSPSYIWGNWGLEKGTQSQTLSKLMTEPLAHKLGSCLSEQRSFPKWPPSLSSMWEQWALRSAPPGSEIVTGMPCFWIL